MSSTLYFKKEGGSTGNDESGTAYKAMKGGHDTKRGGQRSKRREEPGRKPFRRDQKSIPNYKTEYDKPNLDFRKKPKTNDSHSRGDRGTRST